MRVSIFATVVGLALVTAVANAQVTIWEGPGSFFGQENVLFNDSSLMQTGNTVQGYTNRSGLLVDFHSTTEMSAKGGQAQINTFHKNDLWTDLSLNMNDSSLGISTLVFSLDAVQDGQITFNITSDAGVTTQTFDLDKNGRNWFRIAADEGVMISSVSFLSDVGVKDVRHVRLGAVPEPATLIGLGLGAIALMRRRKKATA